MSFWEPENLRRITAGRWVARPAGGAELIEPDGLAIDSRTICRGQVFLAIRGEKFDGHDYLAAAFNAGAALGIVDREDCLSELTPTRDCVLLVNDSLKALTRLATAYRRSLGATVIAITGSVGKTTTKAMIDGVLRTSLTGTVAVKSFNNHIGVPLTLLSAQPADQYVVVEVGTNAPGEIAALARIVEPDVAIITHIGYSHTEKLGGLAGVAQEKAALLRHMRSGGLAIVNGDSVHLAEHLRMVQRVLRFGRGEHCDLRLTDYAVDGGGCQMQVNGRVRFRLPVVGEHNAINALAAVAVGRHMNLSDEKIAKGLAEISAPPMRLESQVVGTGLGIRLINDAYNANPESMLAALKVLSASSTAGRRVAILGDMAELGDLGPRLHREIGQRLSELGIDRAIVIGRLARLIGESFAEAGGGVESFEQVDPAAIARIVAEVRPGDIVLVKASRCMALERVAAAIIEHHQSPSPVV